MGMFKDDAPPAPNYSAQINAANAIAAKADARADEQFNWAKQTYADNKSTNDRIAQNQIRAQEDQLKNSETDRARYESQFQPLEDALVHDANTYDSAENKDRMRGRAVGNVSSAFEAERSNTMRDLESYGVNPGAVRYAGLDTAVRTAKAASEAAAGSQSDLQTEATARGLRTEAINVGRGYPGQNVGETGASVGAGSAGAGGILATTNSGANTMGTGMGWSGTAIGGINAGVNAQNTSYANQGQQWQMDQAGAQGVGSAIGMAAGIGAKYGSGKLFAASGGEVPDMVPDTSSPSRGRAIDDVDAKLTPGEMVLPKDVVSWLGEEKLQKLIQKARQDKLGAPAKPEVRQAISGPATYRSNGSAIPMHAAA